ncbi:MAG: DUF4129 domain-containing protein [Firmicutes bacterium]|nr:DUF4129 domain-containing protein [Bacillota bacterium]MBE3590897.1 DUF4129 domain-containing protein [Bacillota bacterium]
MAGVSRGRGVRSGTTAAAGRAPAEGGGPAGALRERRRARAALAAAETATALGLALTWGRGLPPGAFGLFTAALWAAGWVRLPREGFTGRPGLRAAALAVGLLGLAAVVAAMEEAAGLGAAWGGDVAHGAWGGAGAGAAAATAATAAALWAAAALGAWRGSTLARAALDTEDRRRWVAAHALAWWVAAWTAPTAALRPVLGALAAAAALALLLGLWRAQRAALMEEAAWDGDGMRALRALRLAAAGAALAAAAGALGAAARGPAGAVWDRLLHGLAEAVARLTFPLVAWLLGVLQPYGGRIREQLERVAQSTGVQGTAPPPAPPAHGQGWTWAALAAAAAVLAVAAALWARRPAEEGGAPADEAAFLEVREALEDDAAGRARTAAAGAPEAPPEAVRRVRAAYRRWARAAARRGRGRAPAETAREHARAAVARPLAAAPAAAELLQIYERARYGGLAGAEDARRAEAAARAAEAEVAPRERA